MPRPVDSHPIQAHDRCWLSSHRTQEATLTTLIDGSPNVDCATSKSPHSQCCLPRVTVCGFPLTRLLSLGRLPACSDSLPHEARLLRGFLPSKRPRSVFTLDGARAYPRDHRQMLRRPDGSFHCASARHRFIRPEDALLGRRTQKRLVTHSSALRLYRR